jgi:ABC-type multidrug transport system fused ATPase/permease subunit
MLSLIKTEFQSWTIVAIVHRLKFIPQFFDQVIVMDEGRVVECDEPETLLSDPSSLFGQMTEAEQTSDERD